MRVTDRKEISQSDYNRYTKHEPEKAKEFVGWAAHFSPYPPAGYGMSHERLEEINGRYFVVWERSDNCD
jgi:hypothetical protein